MSLVEEATAAEPPALEAWLEHHGPLSTRSALLLALRILAQASQMRDEQLRGMIDSLAVDCIRRRAQEDWRWEPAARGPAAPVHETDIIERTGIVLFTCLTGQPPAHARTRDALRASLRLSRADLPGHLSEIVARMATARTSAARSSCDSVADELRHLAAVDAPRPTGWPRRSRWWVLAMLALAATGWSLASTSTATDGDPDGLTRDALTTVAVTNESVDMLALTDEHTASYQLMLQEEKILRQELTPDDPRIAWNTVRQAWVRTLAGDDLTAEQLLANKPMWLDAQLGPRHPYGRAARLMLASVLGRRGAADADSLHAAATRASAELLGDPERLKDLFPQLPSPSGVLAHVAPNAPAREGFWRDAGGRHRAQLTSTVLWIAGRDGWRLHLVAVDECRATMVVGTNPRELTVTLSRLEGRWHAAVAGTQPALELTGEDRRAVAVSLIGDPAGVRLHLDDAAVAGTLDVTAPAPVPPYTLSFQGRTPDACRVVWAEVPLPRTAR